MFYAIATSIIKLVKRYPGRFLPMTLVIYKLSFYLGGIYFVYGQLLISDVLSKSCGECGTLWKHPEAHLWQVADLTKSIRSYIVT